MTNRNKKFHDFRQRHPFFSYDDLHYSLDDTGLSASWDFTLAGWGSFHPSLFIPRKSWFQTDKLILPHLRSVLFNIGMVELISYWKAACPPEVIIRPFRLKKDQADWWKTLYWNGMGEFFHINGIEITRDSMMKIVSGKAPVMSPAVFPVSDGLIIPVGGGKDSAVTLELLGNYPGMLPMIMNPREASLATLRVRGCGEEEWIEVQRNLHPALLELNSRGFLNGHTPFSALLAFITVLTSLLSERRFIALSNESSANESTVPGTHINHQYSKTFAFESSFRTYLNENITSSVDYFSFLRPLGELQIARIFAGFKKYHPVFRSCNLGSKTGSWCGSCAKCLFTAIILAPFLPDEYLQKIFGRDLFSDAGLLPLLDQLSGLTNEKPFECVGTIEEVNMALCETIRKRDHAGLPLLLEQYRASFLFHQYMTRDFREYISRTGSGHFLPDGFKHILMAGLHG